jgi:hypothetical protein
MKAIEVYCGSDGELTKRYYGELEKRGPIGLVAMNLFRAQKCSTRAKTYRGGIRGQGSFKRMAYDRKAWSMDNLVAILEKHAVELNITFGWKKDIDVLFGDDPSWVLYIDLPQGQVSFHSPARGKGPDYPGRFDGLRKSAERIIEFCDSVMTGVMS